MNEMGRSYRPQGVPQNMTVKGGRAAGWGGIEGGYKSLESPNTNCFGF